MPISPILRRGRSNERLDFVDKYIPRHYVSFHYGMMISCYQSQDSKDDKHLPKSGCLKSNQPLKINATKSHLPEFFLPHLYKIHPPTGCYLYRNHEGLRIILVHTDIVKKSEMYIQIVGLNYQDRGIITLSSKVLDVKL